MVSACLANCRVVAAMVDLAVRRLRDEYQKLTALMVVSDELFGASRETVAAAREVIERVKARSRDAS
jgi:hypothetical protein